MARIKSTGKEFHYFVVSIMGWNVHEDLFSALKSRAALDARVRKINKLTANIFKVPVSITENYKIVDYVPQVEGVEFIDSVQLKGR